jgi:hypothetical protein
LILEKIDGSSLLLDMRRDKLSITFRFGLFKIGIGILRIITINFLGDLFGVKLRDWLKGGF